MGCTPQKHGGTVCSVERVSYGLNLILKAVKHLDRVRQTHLTVWQWCLPCEAVSHMALYALN